jgi:hypothetical protein
MSLAKSWGRSISGSKGNSVKVDTTYTIFIVVAPIPSVLMPKFARASVTILAIWIANVKKMALSKKVPAALRIMDLVTPDFVPAVLRS